MPTKKYIVDNPDVSELEDVARRITAEHERMLLRISELVQDHYTEHIAPIVREGLVQIRKKYPEFTIANAMGVTYVYGDSDSLVEFPNPEYVEGEDHPEDAVYEVRIDQLEHGNAPILKQFMDEVDRSLEVQYVSVDGDILSTL